MAKTNGTVKWFSARRGYGFITGEDGLDYFCHFSEIQMEGFRKLRGGQVVSFEGIENEEGRTAIQIEPLVDDAKAE